MSDNGTSSHWKRNQDEKDCGSTFQHEIDTSTNRKDASTDISTTQEGEKTAKAAKALVGPAALPEKNTSISSAKTGIVGESTGEANIHVIKRKKDQTPKTPTSPAAFPTSSKIDPGNDCLQEEGSTAALGTYDPFDIRPYAAFDNDWISFDTISEHIPPPEDTSSSLSSTKQQGHESKSKHDEVRIHVRNRRTTTPPTISKTDDDASDGRTKRGSDGRSPSHETKERLTDKVGFPSQQPLSQPSTYNSGISHDDDLPNDLKTRAALAVPEVSDEENCRATAPVMTEKTSDRQPPSCKTKRQRGNKRRKRVDFSSHPPSSQHLPYDSGTTRDDVLPQIVGPGAISIIPGVVQDEESIRVTTADNTESQAPRVHRGSSRMDILTRTSQNEEGSLVSAEAVPLPEVEAALVVDEELPPMAFAVKNSCVIDFHDWRVRVGLILGFVAFVASAISLGVTLSGSTASSPDESPPSSSPTAFPIRSTWIQRGSNIPGPSELAKFGWAVSMSADGSRLAIGAPDYKEEVEGVEVRRGLVGIYEFQQEEGNYTLLQEILGDPADYRLGYSVSISRDGNRVAAGAVLYNDTVKGENTGQVKVFEYRNSSWVPLGNPLVGEAANDWYGYSVSLSRDGSRVAVGGRWNDGDYGRNRGHVRIHEFVGGDWRQLGDDIDGEAPKDIFGHSISLSWDGRVVAVGGRDNDGNGPQSGHVRVYSYTNRTWSRIGQDLDGEAAGDKFGYSVSLSSDGRIVAIGSRLNDGNGDESGHVRVYQYDAEENIWIQLGDDIDGEAATAHSGHSVSLSVDGKVLAMGATEVGRDGSTSGHTRIVEYDGTSWIQSVGTIYGEAPGDQSGWSVSLSEDGSRVAIGAELNDANGDNSGLVQVFESPFP